jgi:hypothetical protein
MGPVLRIGVALLLCAACFQAGRWYQELSGTASAHVKSDPGTEMVNATFRGAPEPASNTVETSQSSAAGEPVGQGSDIITPLNVRDPSALVMGPGGHECVPPAAVEAEPAAKEVKPLKLKKGRLLELLKKADKKSDSPKNY